MPTGARDGSAGNVVVAYYKLARLDFSLALLLLEASQFVWSSVRWFLFYSFEMLPDSEVEKLRQFVGILRAKPDLLWETNLDFFREYLLSLGAALPDKKAATPPPGPEAFKKSPEPPRRETPPPEPMSEDEEEAEEPESEVELDMEGVIGECWATCATW